MIDWTEVIVIGSVVVGMMLLFTFGLHSRKRVQYDCDLCGRHVETVEWQSSKAACCHICDDCAEIEAQTERFYQAIDRRK